MTSSTSNAMKENAELKKKKINHMQKLVDEAFESGIATESLDEIIELAVKNLRKEIKE